MLNPRPAAAPAKNHSFDKSILREYDIRGTVGNTLKEDDCYFTGRAFGTLLKRKGGKTAVVGFDGRESSPGFADAVIRGLNDCGIDVENIGLGPTPMVYFAMKSKKRDAALVVTGSHSPLAYNGIKMSYYTGPFYGDMVQEIGRLALKGDFESGSGTSVAIDVQDAYVDRMMQDYSGPKDLTVAWDNGNGASGEIVRRLTKKLPGKHILLYDDIDGTFPNHHPDPTVAKNLIDLQKAVKEHKCDVGIGLDGDGDRIGAVDEKGNILWADLLMAVYAGEILKEKPGAFIVADVKSSRVLFDEVTRLGGKPVMWNTGHSLIKAKMQELDAALAGELSGHICFADKYYGFDDAPYCAVRLLNLISNAGKPLSALAAHLPKMHNTPEARFAVDPARKFKVAGEIKERLQKEGRKDVDVNAIDGVRVTTPDGWWLLRASNTEDLLVARAEGFTPEGLGRLKDQLAGQLAASGLETPFGKDADKGSAVELHPRVLELIASRICHDLVSPVGAVSNGVELMQELGDDAGEEAVKLIADSAAQAGIRLKAFRLSYGAAGTDKNVGFKEIREVFTDLLKSGRVQAEFEPDLAPKFASAPRGFFKCLLNLLILAEECNHGEGKIHIAAATNGSGARILVTGRNPNFREGAERALKGETPAEELDPRSVHAYITGKFAAYFGFTLSWQAQPDFGRLELQLTF